MYLRSKKTGEVVDWSFVGPTAIKEYEGEDVLLERERYESIEEFISEWEDYKPAEPLIKDEKIRKAVRAWADGNNIESVHYDAFWRGFRRANSSITVWEELPLEDNEVYTITELCGEGEE